jgi:hypothetical protein
MNDMFEKLAKTQDEFSQGSPEVCFTDSCCRDREILQRNFKSLIDGHNMPYLELPKDMEVEVIHSKKNADRLVVAVTEILARLGLETKGYDTAIVNTPTIFYDSEWPLGSSGKVSVIQLYPYCENYQKIYILQVDDKLPPALEYLLKHPRIKFVGQFIHLDNINLKKTFGFNLALTFDIKELYPALGKMASLDKLVQKVLTHRLNKDMNHRDWGNTRLSKQQVKYAALDVYSLFLLYTKTEKEVNYSPSASSPVSLNSTSSPSRVKLDPFHFFQRFQTPKKHIYNQEFSNALKNAIFIVNEKDRKRVELFLKGQKNQLTFDFLYDRNSPWLLRRIRRTIPEPLLLKQRIAQVLEQYTKPEYIDPESGLPLLSKEVHLHILKNELQHVEKGCLSDVPGVNLYFKVGYGKEGLPLYRCCRGTNNLEGGLHQKLGQKVRSWNAGLDYMDCLLSHFIYRYNIRSSRKNRNSMKNFVHYDIVKLENVKSLAKKLEINEYDFWKSVNRKRPVNFIHF